MIYFNVQVFYVFILEQEALKEDPRIRLEKENQRLLTEKMRLDRENDFLANKLTSSQISMQQTIDQVTFITYCMIKYYIHKFGILTFFFEVQFWTNHNYHCTNIYIH